MLVITCTHTRAQLAVVAVADFGNNYATTQELALAFAKERDEAEVNTFNNFYTIVESDGETYSIVVNTVNEFMQELQSGSFEIEFDADEVLSTIQRYMQ